MIAINVDLPKNCLSCPVKLDGSDAQFIWACPFTGYEYTEDEGVNGRLEECPMINLPGEITFTARMSDLIHVMPPDAL